MSRLTYESVASSTKESLQRTGGKKGNKTITFDLDFRIGADDADDDGEEEELDPLK